MSDALAPATPPRGPSEAPSDAQLGTLLDEYAEHCKNIEWADHFGSFEQAAMNKALADKARADIIAHKQEGAR